ncbi:hypothetical protein CHU98_g2669 [Xylaria longipes]|nr:hypothetical protein CHU98_g2669 [Xylaria longipes]
MYCLIQALNRASQPVDKRHIEQSLFTCQGDNFCEDDDNDFFVFTAFCNVACLEHVEGGSDGCYAPQELRKRIS